jgi:GntR family transcriptional regulator
VDLVLDPEGRGTLHERIAAAVRRMVAEGGVRAGARLPTARELAGQLGVNTNTVLRAYRLLADEDLVELRRGRGVTVTGDPDRAELLRLADRLLAEAARHGMSRGELLALLASRW